MRAPGTVAAAALTLLAAAMLSPPAGAVDRIVIEARSIDVADVAAEGLVTELRIVDESHSTATLTLAGAHFAAPEYAALATQVGPVRNLLVRCEDPVVSEPRFACSRLHLELRSDKLGPQSLDGKVDYRAASGGAGATLQASATGLRIAGATVQLGASLAGPAWRVRAATPAVSFLELQKLAKPWYALPPGFGVQGTLGADVELSGRAALERATLHAHVRDAGFTNEAATIIGEKLALDITVATTGGLEAPAGDLEVRSTAGQMLTGPVLLDFGANPLQLTAHAAWKNDELDVPRFSLQQRDLARASGRALVRTAPQPSLRSASLVLEELRFPAAYAAFLQLPLATTDLGSLASTGSASGAVEVRDDQPQRVDLTLHDITLHDDAKQVRLAGLGGELHWTRGAEPPASWLEWREARAFGIEGGAARLDFSTHDADLQLTQPARLPLFDGAIQIQKLAARNVGSTRDLQADFEATIEPISFARISRAFGWPEFGGQLSGRVPGVAWRDNVITFQGNVEAQVFDGTIVARNVRVRDPLGKYPRLYADVAARNLDLGAITSTFEFGGITGRLDGDVVGLETFDWQPTAFEARFVTPASDRSRHRISQKAVQNLSNIGGGGGGVAAALQGGLLRFFETFHYDRLGLSCKLVNDVCSMNGVEPAKQGGFYIVKGSGLPRIDIIGNSHQVDWPLLIAQLQAAVANSGDIVVK